MMSCRIFRVIAAVCAFSALVSASASVVNSGSFVRNADQTSYTFSFAAGNADKLILCIGTESGVAISGVSYNGEALTHIADSGSGGSRNRGIWYLDNPFTGGAADIVVLGNGVNNFSQIGLGVVSVAGIEDGFEAATKGPATSLSLTIPGNNRFVFACMTTQAASAPTANTPLTQLFSGSPESMEAAAGYQFGVGSGSKTFSFTASGTDPGMGLASFVMIPETVPPAIASLDPADDEIQALADADLVATFSETVKAGTGHVTLHLASDDSVVETFNVTSSSGLTFNGSTLTINPSINLETGTEYYVLIDATAIQDVFGNAFPGIPVKTAWNFRTKPAMDSVEGRMLVTLQGNIDNPWPGIDNPNNPAGVFPYALACLYLNQNVSQANQLIIDFYTNRTIPDKNANGSVDYGYFWQNIMWRLYHDPTSGSRLSPQARTIIETNMWNWLRTRSTLAEAQQSEWIIFDSENHDAMTKGSHLMCLLALKNSPDYGPNRTFPGGTTIAQHLTAWTNFYLRYFKARAKEGINVEIASPQYARYTVGAYYNIMDFTDSPELKALATKFIDLYWADTASDWVSSGVRGGGETRVYRDGTYLETGGGYAFRSLLWGYGWHQQQSVGRTYALITAVSPYRVPDIITASATDPNRPNFLYSSRRFGRGGEWNSNRDYTVVFDNGDSNLRRDTWVTPDYSMGTITVDMNRDYIALIDQNRAMGIMFASGVDHRIMVFGKGDAEDISFADTTGVTREDCMIVQRDKNATRGGNATQIFVAQAAWDNRVETGGWFFTQLGNAYCAVRPAEGGYTAESAGPGYHLTLNQIWAPVIIQTGQAQNYASFNAFQASVMANPITYAGGILNYTSEAGDTFTFYANTKTTPRVKGSTVNLNPTKVYDSPYLSMVHGEEIATVSYPGYPDLVLNFGDPLTLLAREPVDNATGVSVFSDLVATFSEPVVAGTGSIVLRRTSDNSVVESFNVATSPRLEFAGANLTINPTAKLSPSTSYYVTVDPTAVVDLSGVPFEGLAGNAGWNFTTNASALPSIIAVNSGKFGGSAPAATVTQPITVGAGADMLVVMTSSELGGTVTTPISVTYGGVAMKRAVGNQIHSAIWYLDLSTPGISGTDVVVDMSGYPAKNGFAAGWVSIKGNMEDGQSIVLHSTGTSGSGSNTVGLATTLETFNVVNFNGNDTAALAVNSPNPTVIYTDTNIGSARAAAAYEANVAAGTSIYQWTLTAGTLPADYRRIDAAAFAVGGGNTFANWIGGFPAVGGQTGLNDDPDGDGNPNGVEAWFGTHPAESSGGLSNLATDMTTTTFIHPMSENPPNDLTLIYQWSANLVDWYDGDGIDGPASGETVSVSSQTLGTTTTVAATANQSMDCLFLRPVVLQNQ